MKNSLLNILSSFHDLTKFEKKLWITSMVVVTLSYVASFILSSEGNVLTLIASLIGVTALIFVSKGYVLGQALTVVFAVFYGIISFFFHYYGEVITYLCMTSPIALISVFSWLKHPYEDTKEVTVNKMNRKQTLLLILLTILVTIIFYYILGWLHTANLVTSTISITTSFLAASLAFLRSPYYALAYSANDIVLIILWILASMENLSYIPMILCFLMFLANDMYGFINWKRIQRKQN